MPKPPESNEGSTQDFSFVVPPGVDRITINIRLARPPPPEKVDPKVGKYAKFREYRDLISAMGDVANHLHRLNFDEDEGAIDSELNRAKYQLYLRIWSVYGAHKAPEALDMYQTAYNQLSHTDVVRQGGIFVQERLRGIFERRLNDALNNPPVQK